MARFYSMKTLQIHQTRRNTIPHSLLCIIMLYYFILRKVISLPGLSIALAFSFF